MHAMIVPDVGMQICGIPVGFGPGGGDGGVRLFAVIDLLLRGEPRCVGLAAVMEEGYVW